MVLLRKVIGDALRARRQAQHRTLREVSTAANVSLGYLSEIERGHKEASSELLASICDALGAPLSQMLGDVSATFALAEQMEEAFSPAGAAALESSDVGARSDWETSEVGAHADWDSQLAMEGHPANAEAAVTDGALTVQVHSDGPLKTMLTTKRTPPGQRHTESVFAA